MTSEHLKAFAGLEDVEFSGIFSLTKSRSEALAKQYGIKNVYNSVEELYESTRADLVVISVPELSTLEVCKKAFKYPWTLLVEKPVGYDLANAKEIYRLSQEAKSKVFVALNRRHYSSTRRLIKELSERSGTRYIHITDQEDPIAALKAGQPEIVVKNWMYANSIHLIDYFNFLGRGKIISVEPVVKWNPEKPSHVLTKITYSSGDIGIYEAAWNRPGPWSAIVTLDDSRWELRPVEQIAWQAYGTRKLEALPVDERDTQFKPGLRLQAEEALKAVRGESHFLPDLSAALASMELVSQIYS